ncbi:MAG: hypothetical protein ACYTBS_08995 [Planctomycetota bacterium]|jgi:hypothetical protein
MYKKLIIWCITAALGLSPLCGTGLGADKPADKSVEVRRLLLVPAPEPKPAMAYRLLPRQLDKKTGNAALFYYSAAALCPDGGEESVSDKISDWRGLRVEELPRKEVEEALAQFSNCFHYIELASRCTDCQWETPVEDGYSLQMPHLSTFRRMAFALDLQIRLKVADGQIDQAIELLQQGLQMGRDIAEGPTLIENLVGVAISALTLKGVEGLAQTPESPNLYWALTALPDPMIDMYSSLEYEREALFIEFPQLRNLEDEVLTPAQASAIVSESLQKIAGFSGGPRELPFAGILPIGWVMLHYADAKQFLAHRGFSQERIEAMPAAQAVLIYQKQEYLEMMDDLFKWFAIQYRQSRTHLEEGERQLGRLFRDKLKANVFSILFPALYRVAFLQTRLDRNIAMLRTVEAMRMFAADHSGRLPRTLDEITSVPVPSDPVTGERFVYRRTDAKNARLEAPKSPAESSRRPVWELTVRQ